MQKTASSNDNDKKTTLAEKVRYAFEYYRAKYKTAPDICFVNPAMMDGSQHKAPVTIKPYNPLTPGNIWIGIDDSRRIKK